MLTPTAKKVYVFFLKYSPTIGAMSFLVHYSFLLINQDRTILPEYIVGLSFLAYVFLMASSKVFGFCKLHRAFITYIAIGSLDINLHHWGQFTRVPAPLIPHIMLFFGVTLFVMLAIKTYKERNESTPIRADASRPCR